MVVRLLHLQYSLANCCIHHFVVLFLITFISCQLLFATRVTLSSFQYIVDTAQPIHLSAANETTDKPYFIFHVGPQKTATTTIQQQLRFHFDLLTLDNYFFAGSYTKSILVGLPRFVEFADILKNVTCHDQVRAARIEYESQNRTSGNWWDSVACWKRALDQIHEHRGKHILISDENLADINSETSQLTASLFDWPTLLASLPEYNMLAIVSYRRYADWLPSAKFEGERFVPSKRLSNLWPSEGGCSNPPFLPSFAFEPVPRKCVSAFYTNDIVRILEPMVPVKIFNMHDLQGGNLSDIHRYVNRKTFTDSITAAFVCRALPHASITCAAIRNEDRINELGKKKAVQMNQRLVMEYTDVILRAAEAGLIDATCTSRYSANEAVKMQQSSFEEINSSAIPRTCPRKNDLSRFLKLSIEYEEELLPDFARSSEGRAAHETAFWNSVKQKSQKYCELNTQVLFRWPFWKSIFADLKLACNESTQVQ
jgi:hypothetical protein